MTTMAGSAHPGSAARPGRTRHVPLRDERGHLGLRRPWPWHRAGSAALRISGSLKPLPARWVTGCTRTSGCGCGRNGSPAAGSPSSKAYADTDESGRIARLDLLCTGYRLRAAHD